MTVVTCPLGNCVYNKYGVCTCKEIVFHFGGGYGNSVCCQCYRIQ